MSEFKQLCRICKKPFTPCLTKFDNELGNYRQYCCSYECGAKYISQILESRDKRKNNNAIIDTYSEANIIDQYDQD